ncbi:MAG TPA: ABC transporter substrate-binding protein [Novosphingobium sp.]|nr:ABC transporter substrate-binding protein [Novosphingobium sp.]
MALLRRVGAPLALGMGAAAALVPAAAMAQARDAQAEAYVDANARRVLGVLNDHHLSVEGRRQAFHTLIGELVDWPRLTRFVLGKYARTATPDQFQRFAAAYRTYEEGVYQRRIDDYKGERAVVSGSLIRKPGDVIVTTLLSGGQSPQPTALSWRVLGGGAGWKVVDVEVKGVWLAITQQQDFVSTIDNAGGKIDVLTAQLARNEAPRR